MSEEIVPTRRMWEGGPVRQFSESRTKAGWMPLNSGGFAGPYVCSRCHSAVSGVYGPTQGWICAECIGLDGKARRENAKAERP